MKKGTVNNSGGGSGSCSNSNSNTRVSSASDDERTVRLRQVIVNKAVYRPIEVRVANTRNIGPIKLC